MALTTLQLTNYQNEGFLVLNDFVDPTECDLLRDRIIEMIREFEPADVASIFSTREQNRIADEYFLNSANNISFFFEENAFSPDGALKQDKELSINKIGHALHDLDPVFDRFSRTNSIEQLALELGVDNPLLLQSMYIFKQPHIGGEVNCHQDCTFLYTEPQDLLGLWFALEDATLENGCLWVLPGGHQRGLKSRWVRTENGMQFETFDTSPWAEEELIPLDVKKGSLIVLNGLLPHRSLENRSPKSRHAYTLHIISGDSHYPSDNWLQRPKNMPLRGF
ncbi:MAG TPA: phytanoyl-CoA dioxygenase family protein [Pyrinomonadaceae bacterium]|jgi:phytanoyl-CoA hydroxylase|nr:phytanoyl-CoA dioxygenase family protein [Pyrinomonadaceae bacterium]